MKMDIGKDYTWRTMGKD